MLAHWLVILIASLTTENILLSRYLGMCSFLAVSNSLKSSIGLGMAVVFVLAFTCPLNALVFQLLEFYHLEYLQYIAFILVIAAFVQVVEMVVERVSMTLYLSLGIFLPLITVNCAILGGSLFMVIRKYSVLDSFVFGVGSGLGWLLAIVLMAGIRERMKKRSAVVPALEGPGIALIVAGIMAMAFIGFQGLARAG